MISTRAIQEFKELYSIRFGIELTDLEAQSQALNLLHLYKILLQIEGAANG